MSIFGEIDKIITEHGSATILKERLALAAEQHAALERKLAAAEGEKLRLQEEANRLVQENQRLNAELAKHQSATDTLDDKKKRILIVVARHTDGITTQNVTRQVGLHEIEVNQAMTELAQDKYVRLIAFVSGGKFAVAARGEKYLIDHNLLSEVGAPIHSSRGSMFRRQPF